MSEQPGAQAIARAHQPVAARLRALALSLPGAYEEFPWGERVIKVNKRVFVFLGKDDPGSELGLSVKLPQSGEGVLTLPFTEPTGYGLGRAGWVTARFTPEDDPPVELLFDWIEESYCAIAPKRLAAQVRDRAV